MTHHTTTPTPRDARTRPRARMRRVKDVDVTVSASDTDFVSRARDRGRDSKRWKLALAMAIRKVEDDDDDPRAWYELACEAFDAGDRETCARALDRCETLDGTWARDARFALRRAHCAAAANDDGDEGTMRAIDDVFRALDASGNDMPSDVRAVMVIDACGLEREWARRGGRETRAETERARERAMETLRNAPSE